MKERVTLTIEAAVLRQVDARIDGNKIRNRSHAVELLLRDGLKNEIPETAIILVGGKDEQIRRALTPVNGKTALEHNISLLLDAGISHILIISKDTQKIRDSLPEVDANIRFINETSPMGTAGALHLAGPYLNSTFVVLNADDIKDIDIGAMYKFHNNHNGMCSIALTTTPDPSQYGVALLNGNRIITFIEKPSNPAPSNLISAGCYFLDPQALELIPEGYATLETDLFPKLTQQDTLFGYPFSGDYKHV